MSSDVYSWHIRAKAQMAALVIFPPALGLELNANMLAPPPPQLSPSQPMRRRVAHLVRSSEVSWWHSRASARTPASVTFLQPLRLRARSAGHSAATCSSASSPVADTGGLHPFAQKGIDQGYTSLQVTSTSSICIVTRCQLGRHTRGLGLAIKWG